MEVKTHKNRIDSLETRISANEKSLSQLSFNPSINTDILVFNDITYEIHLKTLCASNNIIRGVPESPDSSVSNIHTHA